jgi:3D (Asp-Asp-Asp) domain-containing protein
MKTLIYFISLTIVMYLTGCESDQNLNSMEVTATAYTSSPGQTDSTPFLAAWGDTLKPGIKTIAVSRDLLKLGLSHNKEVKIEGLKGTYIILDKMNKRWKKKIDIYMGTDVDKAREWGKKKVTIYWEEDAKP